MLACTRKVIIILALIQVLLTGIIYTFFNEKLRLGSLQASAVSRQTMTLQKSSLAELKEETFSSSILLKTESKIAMNDNVLHSFLTTPKVKQQEMPHSVEPVIRSSTPKKALRPSTPKKALVKIIRGNSGHERSSVALDFTQENTHRTIKCPNKMRPNIPGGRFKDNTLYKSGRRWTRSVGPTRDWGNMLSPYWAARTMAELGGYEFRLQDTFMNGTWMQYLPSYAPARYPREDIYLKVCSKCTHFTFFHFGECANGWGQMAPMIREDTRNALLKYSKLNATQEENNQIFNFFKPADWLIYNRCLLFKHWLYAPGVLRTYSVLPESGEFNVFIMMGRKED